MNVTNRTEPSLGNQMERMAQPKRPDTAPLPSAPEANVAEMKKATENIDQKVLVEAVEKANSALRMSNLDFRFSQDDGGQMVVQVVDSQTEKIVRQIPSKEMLELSKSLEKMQGLLLKQEA